MQFCLIESTFALVIVLFQIVWRESLGPFLVCSSVLFMNGLMQKYQNSFTMYHILIFLRLMPLLGGLFLAFTIFKGLTKIIAASNILLAYLSLVNCLMVSEAFIKKLTILFKINFMCLSIVCFGWKDIFNSLEFLFLGSCLIDFFSDLMN